MSFDENVPDPASDDAAPNGRHPVNIGHLVMGIAFIGLVAVWALLTSDAIELNEARWILPLPWLVAGAIGILATLARGRRSSGKMQGWQQHSPDSRD